LKTRKRIKHNEDLLEEPLVKISLYVQYSEEEKAVSNSLPRISINARRKAFRKNSAVTIIRNGRILKVLSNRKVKAIGIVKKVPIEVDVNKPIKIK
jgi:hypothetical protein